MKRCDCLGHALLELVMVLPLLLIFLTVAFDIGLYFTDRGLTDNAIRVALNQVKSSENVGESELSRRLVSSLVAQLTKSWSKRGNTFLAEWQLSAVPIELFIDRTTARVKDVRFNYSASSHAQSSNQLPKLSLDEKKTREQLSGAYGFAKFSLGDRQIGSKVNAILISVKANPRGAHQEIAQKFLGSSFQIQREIIVPIRSDYGQP